MDFIDFNTPRAASMFSSSPSSYPFFKDTSTVGNVASQSFALTTSTTKKRKREKKIADSKQSGSELRFSPLSKDISTVAFRSIDSTSSPLSPDPFSIMKREQKGKIERSKEWGSEDEGSVSSQSDIDTSDLHRTKAKRAELRRQENTLATELLKAGESTPPRNPNKPLICPDSDKSTRSYESAVGLDLETLDIW